MRIRFSFRSFSLAPGPFPFRIMDIGGSRDFFVPRSGTSFPFFKVIFPLLVSFFRLFSKPETLALKTCVNPFQLSPDVFLERVPLLPFVFLILQPCFRFHILMPSEIRFFVFFPVSSRTDSVGVFLNVLVSQALLTYLWPLRCF